MKQPHRFPWSPPDEEPPRVRPTIPLDRALLCLDCDSLFEAEAGQACPACGSRAAWSLGRALNRPMGGAA